jgi:hypothetical protein
MPDDLGTFTYTYSYSNPLIFSAGQGIKTHTFETPGYDDDSCTLEPDPWFNGPSLYTQNALNCNYNIAYFDTATKKWNCPWDVNFLP